MKLATIYHRPALAEPVADNSRSLEAILNWLLGGLFCLAALALAGPSGPTDIIAFAGIFAILGLTTWLFNRQMAWSLARASLAEAALQKQNEDLEATVRTRTRELERGQLEKMQHMYRFAELGHVSTALFHDLANHLSSVTLDIENLHKDTRPELLERIDDNIRYIDTIVQRVRSQLKGKIKVEIFDIKAELREVVKVSAIMASKANVKINVRLGRGQPLLLRGDMLRFRQVMINLLSNGIESYRDTKTRKRTVDVTLKADRHYAVIEVADHGPGIPLEIRDRIFDPFYTSKAKGVGIGLFIVRQIIDRDLNGEVRLLTSGPRGSTFAVRLPLVSQN